MRTDAKMTFQSVRTTLAWLEIFEQSAIALLLITMILLASYQIMLRWFSSGGLLWIDPLLRYLVLWGGLMGAVYATSRGKHIGLDVVSYLIPRHLKKWLNLVTLCFSAIVSGFLFRAALLFIRSEMEFGGNALFNLPSWLWYLIFPIAFGLICLHFTLAGLLTLAEITGPDQR